MENNPETDPTAAFFRQWREYRGFSQRQVEGKFGWPGGKLSRLEAGQGRVTGQTLTALAGIYACTIADLFRAPPPKLLHPAPSPSGLNGMLEMRAIIERLQHDIAVLRGEVEPRLDDLERQLAEAGKIAQAAVQNAAKLAALFAPYAEVQPRAAAPDEPIDQIPPN